MRKLTALFFVFLALASLQGQSSATQQVREEIQNLKIDLESLNFQISSLQIKTDELRNLLQQTQDDTQLLKESLTNSTSILQTQAQQLTEQSDALNSLNRRYQFCLLTGKIKTGVIVVLAVSLAVSLFK